MRWAMVDGMDEMDYGKLNDGFNWLDFSMWK